MSRTNNKQIAFAFVDETGIAGNTKTQPFFGVGIFVTSKTTILNKELHDVLVKALSYYKITKDRFEFKFNLIHKKNVQFYKKIVRILKNYQSNWNFSMVIEDKQGDSWTQTQLWENYLSKVKIILTEIKEETVVIADYLSKPNVAKESFEDITQIPHILNVMQLESQGSLLLQVADILLGAIVFLLKRGKHSEKKLIAREVKKLLKDKKMRVTRLSRSPSTFFYTTTDINCQEIWKR